MGVLSLLWIVPILEGDLLLCKKKQAMQYLENKAVINMTPWSFLQFFPAGCCPNFCPWWTGDWEPNKPIYSSNCFQSLFYRTEKAREKQDKTEMEVSTIRTVVFKKISDCKWWKWYEENHSLCLWHSHSECIVMFL